MTTNVRFLHLRQYDTSIEGNAVLTKGGKTVCFQEDEGGNIQYATARCAYKDNFCRRIGRQVSKGRFDAGKIETITKEERMKMEQKGPQMNSIECLIHRLEWV